MLNIRRLTTRRKQSYQYQLPDLTLSIIDDLLTWDTTRPPLRDALRYHLVGMLELEYRRGRADA